MARIAKPLTNTEVKNAKPRDKEYNLVDGGGLALRVKPSGSKLWLFNYYQPYTKKRLNISFGSYPDVSLADVRAKRKSARELLAKDIDPREHKEEASRAAEAAHANTLANVVSAWFEVKQTKVTADYADDILRSFKLHIFPDLGKVPIYKIKAQAVIKVLEPIAAKGSLETVKRLCQRINEVMTFAVNTGVIDANPLAGIGKAFQAPDKKHMPSLKPEQLPQLMRALTTASIKITTRCLIEWQLHTMVRPSEAAGTRWDEIDFDSGVWNIPAERMKKPRPHGVPLTPQTLALLDLMKPISGHREFVFVADRDPKKHTNPQTANMALKRMGYGGLLVAHGLRSIASTTLNEQGFDPDVIEAALAHSDKNEVRKAYNRSDYLERRKVLMSWWSEFIESAATGGNTLTTASNVINMTAKG